MKLPVVELPAVEPPAVGQPPAPTAPPKAYAPPPVRPVPVSRQPAAQSAEQPLAPAADRVRASRTSEETPAVAPVRPARTVTSGSISIVVKAVENLADEASTLATPTAVSAGSALVVAAVIGAAASSSASASASGWAGMALMPAALYLSAVGVGRRFSAALRLSAWRISYRPAFAPD